jgi:hypothetical protein
MWHALADTRSIVSRLYALSSKPSVVTLGGTKSLFLKYHQVFFFIATLFFDTPFYLLSSIPRGGVARQGLVLTDLPSILDCQ